MTLIATDPRVSEYIQQAALVEILRILLPPEVMPECGGARSETNANLPSDNEYTA